VTILAALSVAAGQVLSTIYLPSLTLPSVALRMYGTVFCLAVVLFEMEWTKPIREMIIVQNWVLRGLLYAFIGLLGQEEESEPNIPRDAINRYIMLASWTMIAAGLMYILMGLACMKQVRDKRMAIYRHLLAHAEAQEALRHAQQQAGGAGGGAASNI